MSKIFNTFYNSFKIVMSRVSYTMWYYSIRVNYILWNICCIFYDDVYSKYQIIKL